MVKKKFASTFTRGNISPKKRVQILVHNEVQSWTTGQETLSEADIHGLTKGWKPKESRDITQYNRYIGGWRNFGYTEIDVQTLYLQTLVELNRLEVFWLPLQQYPMLSSLADRLTRIKETTPVVSMAEAQNIMNEQRQTQLTEGVEIYTVVYQLTLQSLSIETKERLKEFYDDYEHDHSYVLEELELAEYIEQKDLESIADRISDCWERPWT